METEKNVSRRELKKFHDLAREAASHHFGSRPKRIVHRSGGLTNFVFSFENSDGKFVVRISPEPSRINSFLKEQWAETAAREKGVPVPEILEVGLELIGFPYMIARVVEGNDATHHAKKLDILRELGRHAATINSIKTTGFGQTFDWSANRLSLNSGFKDYLYGEYGFEAKLELLGKHKMLAGPQLKKLSQIFSKAAKGRPRAVLNHGDLRLKNVIAADDGTINAIIDWEGCTSNIAPAWELSLALHDLGIDGKQSFLEGYGISEKTLLDTMPLIKAFNIANYAAAVEGYAAEKNKKRLAQYQLRLSGALDLYSF